MLKNLVFLLFLLSTTLSSQAIYQIEMVNSPQSLDSEIAGKWQYIHSDADLKTIQTLAEEKWHQYCIGLCGEQCLYYLSGDH